MKIFPAALLLALASWCPAASPPRAANFRLLDHEGISRELYRYADRKAVVLIAQMNGCPIFRKSIPEISALRDRFAPRGVAFLLINASPQDGFESVAREAKDYGLELPILMDRSQTEAKTLGITRAAEAFVIDPKGWRIVYRGAIDDRLFYGAEKPAATKRWLRDALEAVLSGRTPATASTEAFGCLLRVDEAKGISYARDAAPILKAKCLACHADPNGAAPMTGYERARAWAPMTREALMTRRMPPWPLDPRFGKFVDDTSLTDEELKTLVGWIDAGAPRGDGADPLAETPPPAEEWPLGKPDEVMSMKEEAVIPEKGPFNYQYYVLEGPLERDVWIQEAQIRPGNPKVVHHAFLVDFSRPPEEFTRDRIKGSMEGIRHGAEDRVIWSWHPGRNLSRMPAGVAIRVPKGHYLALEMHYQPTGRRETDRTKAGLYFFKGREPPRLLRTTAYKGKKILLPPGRNPVEVGPAEVWKFAKAVRLVSFRPHMHRRGSRMRVAALYPDGRRETLLSVVDYRFDWQFVYAYAEPKFLPEGTTLFVDGAFDNSGSNPENPDPTRTVRKGLGTDDEMFHLGVKFLTEP